MITRPAPYCSASELQTGGGTLPSPEPEALSLRLGVEIGGTKLQLVLGTSAGTIQRRWRFHVDALAGSEGIRAHIESVRDEIVLNRPVAAGVGFGGPIDWRTGTVACSHQVEGWSGFPLKAWLEELFHMPASVDNDANVAALAEARLGAGRGSSPLFYVTLGSGVGGGLVVDGRIYHGAAPGESEVGHLRLDRSGAIVESACSGWAMDAKIGAWVEAHPQSRLAHIARERGLAGARLLRPALDHGCPDAAAILDSTVSDLAFALSHVTHLCHPEMIVIGGGLSLVGEPLRASLARQLPHWIMRVLDPGPAIALAELAEDAVPCGALLLAAR